MISIPSSRSCARRANPKVSDAADARFMALALSLGRRGMGRVWPNPAVGCVIVADGRIVGRGHTADGGRPHAETEALAQAGAAARGATAYVTLEPCAHQGQTPPCTNALIDAGVARVVVATGDPDARVAGRGIGLLRAAGIIVDLGVMSDAAQADHAGFLLRVTQNRPFVTLKLALSLDGRTATATGDSHWITGPLARRAVHMMRASNDAVMIGAGTARADDPRLTVRDLGVARQPVRVVIATDLDLHRDGNLARSAPHTPLWLCHRKGATTAPWDQLGATCITCATDENRIAVAPMLNALAERGITRVFCEGGATLAASLIAAGRVDELVVFSAGVTIGGDGLAALGPLGIDKLAEASRWSLKDTRAVGNDVIHVWGKA